MENLYIVRMQVGFNVEAGSNEEAEEKALDWCRRLEGEILMDANLKGTPYAFLEKLAPVSVGEIVEYRVNGVLVYSKEDTPPPESYSAVVVG